MRAMFLVLIALCTADLTYVMELSTDKSSERLELLSRDIQEGKNWFVGYALHANPHLVRAKLPNGLSPLRHAVACNNLGATRELLRLGAPLLEVHEDKKQWVFNACSEQTQEDIELLLKLHFVRSIGTEKNAIHFKKLRAEIDQWYAKDCRRNHKLDFNFARLCEIGEIDMHQVLSKKVLLDANPLWKTAKEDMSQRVKDKILSIISNLDPEFIKELEKRGKKPSPLFQRTLIALAACIGANLNDKKIYPAMARCLHHNDYQLARYLIKKGYVIRAQGSCGDIEQLRHCKTIQLARLFCQYTPRIYLDPHMFYIGSNDDYEPELFELYVTMGLDLHYWCHDNSHREGGYWNSSLLDILKSVDKIPSARVVAKARILIQAGTDLFLSLPYPSGETALHLAAKLKSKDLCQAIVNRFIMQHKGFLQFLAFLRSHENRACRLLYASKPLLAKYFKGVASNQKLLLKLLRMYSYGPRAGEYYRCKGLNPDTYILKAHKTAEVDEDELWREEPEKEIVQARRNSTKRSEGCICF